MASAVIHMAVASEINKKINRDNNKLLIGSIAPDISKYLGENKVRSHFLDDKKTDIPNIDKFLIKYQSKLNDDFVLGYFIHLYTDYLWYKYFFTEIWKDGYVTKLDGTKVKCTDNMATMYMYNDYTNLNSKLLDEYNMDLKIFYNDPPKFDNIIEEIPMDRIDLIINKMSIIIENSKINKDMIFNMDNVNKFIETSTNLILEKLNELNIKN